MEVSRCIFTPVVRHSACLLTGPKCFLPGSPRRDLALRGYFPNQSRSPPRWRLAGSLWETQASSPEDATKENSYIVPRSRTKGKQLYSEMVCPIRTIGSGPFRASGILALRA